MRAGILGFLLGVILMLAGFFALQQNVIRSSAGNIDFRFAGYVFTGPEFPRTYFGGAGQAITHFLFPVRVHVTYYDSQYNEVTSAGKPGRYGAVVRLGFNGGTSTYRFVTLYRSPEWVHWSDGPGSVTGVDFPPGTGVDPQVARNQQAAIGQDILYHFFDSSPRVAVILAGLSEMSPQDPPATERNSLQVRDAYWWHGLRKRLGLAPHYPTLVDLPDGYDADPSKKWPLIFYLHSNATTGNGLEKFRHNELPGHTAELHLPAVVVSPYQALHSEDWSLPAVFDALDDAMAKYRIDPDRVYAIGSSTGGDFVVGMASREPDRFAAIATVGGENDMADLDQLRKVPYWAFEGEDDQVMNPGNPPALIAAIRQAGGTAAHLTLFPGLGHGSWDTAFSYPALWRWLLAQKRGQPEVVTPGVPQP